MFERHYFDFTATILSLDDFYDRIKLVNFIRRQIATKQCFNCDAKYDDLEQLLAHLITSGHMSAAPSRDQFNHPEYYFPTYEDDCFLFFLDDFHEETSVGDFISAELFN